jgi:hypothetical protein
MKLAVLITLLAACNYSFSQDSSFVRKLEQGRFMNISNTNLEVRALELSGNVITLESLSIPSVTYTIIERDKSVLMVRKEGTVRFFEIKKNKIIYYQYINPKETNIAGYLNGTRKVKNVFKRIDFGIYN